jgi:four helix bundle protein
MALKSPSFRVEGDFRAMNDAMMRIDGPFLPHHRLRAFGVAKQLLGAVIEARVSDTNLRNQALKAAQSACLNVAEGAGRVSRKDKARAFTIARGEAGEAAAAVEIAACCGNTSRAAYQKVAEHTDRLVGMLTNLIVR